MNTQTVKTVETHTAHFEYADAIVEIDSMGAARLILRDLDVEGRQTDIVLDPDELAAVLELWKRATGDVA